MRSSALLTCALAAGALAAPHRRSGHMVIETEIATKTVTVYVTEGASLPFSFSQGAGYGAPASTSLATSIATQPIKQPVKVSRTRISKTKATPTPQPEPSTYEAVSPVAPSSTSVSEQEYEPSSTVAPSPSTSATATRSAAATPSASAPSGSHESGPEQAELSSGPEYQAAVLYHHNAARANHDASALTWDSDCEANARIAAEKCTFEHYIPEGAGQGQNLFTNSGDAFNVTAGITESWYKGELPPMMPYFGQNDIPDSVFHEVGHLTQMVWKGTTKVGCVSIDCGSKMVVDGATSEMNKYTVCNYAPAGNMVGAYAENVAAPISSTNLGGWAD